MKISQTKVSLANQDLRVATSMHCPIGAGLPALKVLIWTEPDFEPIIKAFRTTKGHLLIQNCCNCNPLSSSTYVYQIM